jgi:ATP-dependent DNA helicase RecQ
MNKSLSSKSRAVLDYIARGHSYQQILDAYPAFTYKDIFNAAQEALEIIDRSNSNNTQADYNLEQIRKQHPRAYEKWEAGEDEKLRSFFVSGMSTKQIAEALQRQSGAIQSRLRKLRLIE